MAEQNIVIIGAGVSGLTTSLLLARNPRNKITIVAKHMPGDYDIEYTSPWAGADYCPFGIAGTPEAAWEGQTWKPLAHLAEHVPEAGIHLQKTRGYFRNKDTKSKKGDPFGESADPWYKDVVPDFRHLSPSELPPNIDSGFEYTGVCINTALYLPYLVGQCRRAGVILARHIVPHVSEAASLHHTGQPASIIVNCTGLLASRLGGVEDKSVVPARGQTVLVRNDSKHLAGTSGTDDGEDELCYFMSRASGGGTILGGSYQIGNWESQPDLNLANRIMERAVALYPQLAGGKGVKGLSVVRHAVGLRPLRKEGVRLEKERIGGVWVVHNYGHAGFGYQASYGCAESVVKLVDEIVGLKAKL